MTTTFSLLALLVASAAAVRSTWSPCGLSMLSTITPLAERAKGHRYAVTCTWFVVGAVVGGLALGTAVAVSAAVVDAVAWTPATGAAVGLAASLIALASDTGLVGVRVPVHYRQVNERWLDAYRPWVYGAGFGFQIGSGVATYITTAAVYLVVVLGALTGDPLVALAVGGAFGLVRGLAVTLTRRVTTPTGLLAFHREFGALLPWAERAVLATTGLSVIVLATALPGAAPAAVAVVIVAAVAARGVVRAGRRATTSSNDGPPAADHGPSVPVV